MGLYVRKREKSRGTVVGTYTDVHTGVVTSAEYSLGSDYCEDVIGNYPNDNPLFIERKGFIHLGTLSGRAPVFAVNQYDGVMLFGQPNWSHLSPTSTPPSDVQAVTEVAAQTNPSVPHVDLAATIGDFFMNVPEVLYKKGYNYKRLRGGNTVAEINFGWLPLFRDLQKLIDFTRAMDARVKELKNYFTPNGGSNRRYLWADSAQDDSGDVSFWTLEGGVHGYIHTVTTSRKWASVRWKADTAGIPSAGELRSKALSTIHGWRLDPDTIWELMPWSWFVDYFVNIGSFLKATRNNLDIHTTGSCVMFHQRTTAEQIITSASPYWSLTPGVSLYETKYRTLTDIGLTQNAVPLVGARQLVTLLGIAANLR
jgi:hypothetical protein